jgi:DnaK suppressor protein
MVLTGFRWTRRQRRVEAMANIDIEEYRRILLAKEQELAARIEPEQEGARRVVFEPVHDRGDESVLDEEKEVKFTEVNLDWELLNQVRDALQRIQDGIFGKCLEDGRQISEKRLKKMPWAAYCLKHQREKEAFKRIPTL